MNMQAVFDVIRDIAMLIWSYDGAKVILSHTLINVVVAIAAAVHMQEFNLSKIGEFLYRKMLPYVSVYVVAKVVGVHAGLDALSVAVFAIIEATLAGDLADNLVKLGIKLPGQVVAFIAKQ